MDFRIAVLIIVFIGIAFIIIDFVKNTKEEPEVVVEYEYVPVTMDGEIAYGAYPSDIFRTMFSDPSPWSINNDNFDRMKQAQVNRFFISQV